MRSTAGNLYGDGGGGGGGGVGGGGTWRVYARFLASRQPCGLYWNKVLAQGDGWRRRRLRVRRHVQMAYQGIAAVQAVVMVAAGQAARRLVTGPARGCLPGSPHTFTITVQYYRGNQPIGGIERSGWRL